MATSSKPNSRFSSLKVFKFNNPPKPPPLPPKDPYYHQPNPSLRSLGNSLSPDSLPSQPVTPLSAQYANLVRSPSPTPSYAPSRMTNSPYSASLAAASSSNLNYPQSASSRKSRFKFGTFGRRPKTADAAHSPRPSDLLQPPPTDDPSISMPWNFQHNIHVDEAFVGLPPTWNASLLNAGFTDEEIAAIEAKRAESRARSARSIYSLNVGRSASPSTTARSPPYGHQPASLRRDDASISQVSLTSSVRSYGSRSHMRKMSTSSRDPSETSSVPPHSDSESRRTPPNTRPTPTHSHTYPMTHSQSTPHLPLHHHTNSASSRIPPPMPLLPTSTHTPPAPVPAVSVISDNSSSSNTGSGLSEKQLMARNAPSRAFHVANESIGTLSHSPPPAYASPKKDAHLTQADEDFRLPPSVIQPLASTSTGSGTSPVLPTPPRLSFHQDDLSLWSESLVSSIPQSVTLTPPKPPAAPRAHASSSRQSANDSSNRARAVSTSVRGRDRPSLPPQKPVPKKEPPPTLPPPPPPPENNSHLWREVMSMASGMQDTTADFSSDSLYSASLLTPVLDEFPPIPRISDPDQLDLPLTRDKDNRDSGLSTMTVTPATIATAAVARSARPNMVISPVRNGSVDDAPTKAVPAPASPVGRVGEDRRSTSPNSTESHSSTYSVGSLSTGTGSASSDSRPQTVATDPQEWRVPGTKHLMYSDPSPEPSPRAASFAERDTFAVSVTSVLREPESDVIQRRPSIVTGTSFLAPAPEPNQHLSPLSPSNSSPSPSSPAPRYPGWLSAVVAPLKGFINDQLDPRELYTDLREIAEGDSGSVYAARVLARVGSPEKEPGAYVAIKNIAILPSGSPKIDDLRRELTLMKGAAHAHVLSMDALFVDLQEDSLWVRMELMVRSVADVIALVEEGVVMNEGVIAQIAADVLSALDYLQSKGIAHRDVRSDNLLLNREGVVKLADFSSAVQVARINPTVSGPAGVIYWQAPEIRNASYNALKVDVWSLGATVWEMAETEPPFSDVSDPRQLPAELPDLSQPEIYSRSFHDFLHLCSRPSQSRPDPHELLTTPFLRNQSGRQAIVDVLGECQAIEQGTTRRQSAESQGTVSWS